MKEIGVDWRLIWWHPTPDFVSRQGFDVMACLVWLYCHRIAADRVGQESFSAVALMKTPVEPGLVS